MINKKILFLILLAILVLPFAVSAQTIAGMANAIALQVVAVGTWIVVIFWVVTGILFLTAQGEPGALTKAKMALFASIAGTIIVILAMSSRVFICNSFGLNALPGCQ